MTTPPPGQLKLKDDSGRWWEQVPFHATDGHPLYLKKDDGTWEHVLTMRLAP